MQQGPDAEYFPPDALPIASDLAGSPFLLHFRGKHAGAIWFWDHEDPQDHRVAKSFSAFLKMLRQQPDRPAQAELRGIMEKDDVKAMRARVDRLSPDELNASDENTGYTLLESAAGAGAVKIVRLLLERRAAGPNVMGMACVKGQAKVVAILLDHGLEPNEYNWGGAMVSGNPAVIRTLFDRAPAPPRKLLEQLLRGARNQTSAGHRQIAKMLAEVVET
jgi:ankyrin repeat protein